MNEKWKQEYQIYGGGINETDILKCDKCIYHTNIFPVPQYKWLGVELTFSEIHNIARRVADTMCSQNIG